MVLPLSTSILCTLSSNRCQREDGEPTEGTRGCSAAKRDRRVGDLLMRCYSSFPGELSLSLQFIRRVCTVVFLVLCTRSTRGCGVGFGHLAYCSLQLQQVKLGNI